MTAKEIRLRLAEVEDREDVGMGEGRDREGLPLEARDGLGVGGEPVGKDLDGDLAAEPGVARPVDLAHASGPERRQHLVRAPDESRRREP